MKAYDVAFSLGDGLRPGCLQDANDDAQFASSKPWASWTQVAWQHDAQVMIEGPGSRRWNRILQRKHGSYSLKVQRSAILYPRPIDDGYCTSYDHINSGLVRAMIGWYGTASALHVTPFRVLAWPKKRRQRRYHHLQNRARGRFWQKGHPGAQARDNALSKQGFEFRGMTQFNSQH